MDTIEMAQRLTAAVLAGAAIGLNRDTHGKPTGVRLHGLVALGSAVFIIAGLEIEATGVNRVIQGIVGGIGFLGAGVIMHGRGFSTPALAALKPGLREMEHPVEVAHPPDDQGPTGVRASLAIHHLTTAASIWLTAALGVASGAGMWKLVLLAALAALVLLIVGVRVDRRLFHSLGDEDEGGERVD